MNLSNEPAPPYYSFSSTCDVHVDRDAGNIFRSKRHNYVYEISDISTDWFETATYVIICPCVVSCMPASLTRISIRRLRNGSFDPHSLRACVSFSPFYLSLIQGRWFRGYDWHHTCGGQRVLSPYYRPAERFPCSK
jgi:hypothetical protein